MVEIIDLSTLSPKPVIVRIGNGDEIEEIDLTVVPARATLTLTQATQEHGGFDKIPDGEMVMAIADICHISNPTRPQLAGLTQVVLAQAFRRWGGGDKGDGTEGDGKNR